MTEPEQAATLRFVGRCQANRQAKADSAQDAGRGRVRAIAIALERARLVKCAQKKRHRFIPWEPNQLAVRTGAADG
eukprot:scaffold76733_cov57-Phaeocystis_antarctica.AAC.2